MGIQAKYDPREDRMCLTLYPGEGAPCVLWVTRRDWLGLLHTIGALSLRPEHGFTGPSPLRQKRLAGALDTPLPNPALVQGIRFRQVPEGGKVTFLVGNEAITLSLQSMGLLQLKHMLLQQAERADWDAGVALARLNAQRSVRAALRKARSDSGRKR